MKGLPRKLLPLTLFGIAVTSLFWVRPAQAYTVTLEQVGSNVVTTGSGAIDLTGLQLFLSISGVPAMFPAFGLIQTGAAGPMGVYIGVTGPTSFGSGGLFFANSGSGDFVGIGPSFISVPLFYVSGSALSSSATWNNASFASLRRDARHLRVDVGDWITEPEFHARDRIGGCP